MKARQLVFAFASPLPEGGGASEIVYFPEGEHRITATVTVRIPREKGAGIAAAMQAALDQRVVAKVRPWPRPPAPP
ncbi:MAG: hypothetical protein K9N23_01560 [Akkermansiaceae bacterium]|nr:hypothetical protein [Akkermansiaceae bacterium]